MRLAWLTPWLGWIALGVGHASSFVHAETFNFQSLQRLVESKELKSIESVLPLLPARYRSHFALMFRSRSLQGSSYRDPRVILYGEDSKLIVTFNGDSRHKGFDALETMEFDDETKTFRFREIIFPSKPNQQLPVNFSEVNPKKCVECHGSPARPIWDAHPIWPGAYGEKYNAPMGAEELEGMRSFLKQQPTQPRYAQLLKVEKFADPETFKPGAKTKYDGNDREPPNSELTTLLSGLNFQRIIAEVKASQEFDRFKYALLASLSPDCGHLDEFLPEPLRAIFKDSFARFSLESDRLNSKSSILKQYRIDGKSDNYAASTRTIQEASSLKGFRWLVEQGLGISARQWTLALEKQTYDFTTPALSMNDLEAFLLLEVSRLDPKVQEYRTYHVVGNESKYCVYLRRRSLAALANQPLPSFFSYSEGREKDELSILFLPAAVPLLLKRCIECHQSGVGPELPFSSAETLARELRVPNAYTRGSLLDEILFRLSPKAGAMRMPVGTILSDEEQESLANYFRALSLKATPKY